MIIFYNLGLWFYHLLVLIASLFNAKAKKFIAGRKQLFKELEQKTNTIKGGLVWVHCASLGEFEQGRPLIEAIKKKDPDQPILLTFFSPSGYEIRKDYELADIVSYLPLDTKKNAKKFIQLTRPKQVYFIKYEWWYHFTKVLHRQKIPLYSVSCIFRPQQPFFKKGNNIHKKILSHFSHFFVQNKDSKDLLTTIGYNNATLVGDTRFDRVAEICAKKQALPLIENFVGSTFTLVIGSSWPQDLRVIGETLSKYHDLKVIIAPHELHESTLADAESYFKGDSIRYSALKEDPQKTCKALIIDNMGMLSSIYQYAQVAYIGGAFGSGLHNTLEAATFGLPIIWAEISEISRS